MEQMKELFHNAVTNGDVEEFLDDLINSKDSDEETALQKASRHGNVKLVKYLIEKGAHVNSKDKENCTPLHDATYHFHLEATIILVENGAELEAKDDSGWTPLHFATNMMIRQREKQANIELVKYLIEKGSQIEARTHKGSTPLMLTCEGIGNIEIAKYLIQNGAQLDSKRKDGCGIVHIASFSGNLRFLKFLIEECGAQNQIESKNNFGKTPYDLALQKGHLEVAEFLLEKKRDSMDNILQEKIDQKAPCVICFSPRNGIFVLWPCGHASLCEPCCFKMKNSNDSLCPSCRSPITDYKKVFFQQPETK